MQIPDKYKEIVNNISESILIGQVCFFNPDTLETEEIISELLNDSDEFEKITGETFNEMDLAHKSWKNCITIEPMDSYDSFQVMKNFIDEINDKSFQNRLISALNNRKPFANFKNIVENSEYRQLWFDFRQNQLEDYVWRIISEKN